VLTAHLQVFVRQFTYVSTCKQENADASGKSVISYDLSTPAMANGKAQKYKCQGPHPAFEVVSSDNYQVLFLCPLNTPIIFKKPRLSDKI